MRKPFPYHRAVLITGLLLALLGGTINKVCTLFSKKLHQYADNR